MDAWLVDDAEPVVRRSKGGSRQQAPLGDEASPHHAHETPAPVEAPVEPAPPPLTAEEEKEAALRAVTLQQAPGQMAASEPQMPRIDLLHYHKRQQRRRRYSPTRQRVSSSGALDSDPALDSDGDNKVGHVGAAAPAAATKQPSQANEPKRQLPSQQPRMARVQDHLHAEQTGVGDALCYEAMRKCGARLDRRPTCIHKHLFASASGIGRSRHTPGSAPWATEFGTGLQPPGLQPQSLLPID